ncbi:MAG: DUF58 domain-containing protein [Planctomycetota bacterium]
MTSFVTKYGDIAGESGPDRLPPVAQMTQANFEMVVRMLADDLAFGSDDSLFVGSGLEYAQSRPYEPGDPVRQIDWKITARSGRAYLKEYETLKRMSTYLLVDTSGSMSVASTRLSKLDLAVWITAAIGLIAIRRLSPVAIVGAGERRTRIKPSMATSDLWRILEPLRAAQPREATDVANQLVSLDPRLTRRSLIIVISDLHEPEVVGAVCRAAQRHDTVSLHLNDPAEAGSLRAGFFRGTEAETGTAFLGHGRSAWHEDQGIGKAIASAGASYLRLRTDRPFITPLRQFLANRHVVARGRD